MMRLCGMCGGASPAAPCPAGEAGRCRWCRGPSALTCTNCSRGIHVRSECRLWNRGASQRFVADEEMIKVLCPDCGWEWAKTLAASHNPSPARVISEDVRLCLDRLADNVVPGAGHLVQREAAPERNGRRLRRLVLRQVRRSGWVSVPLLVQASGQHGRPVSAQQVHSVVQTLRGEGRLIQRGRGDALEVRLGAPRTHVRRRRRRRQMAYEAQPPARRRRLE